MAGIRLDKLRFYAIFFEDILVAVDSPCIKLFHFYKIPQKLKWCAKSVTCKALWDIWDVFSTVYLLMYAHTCVNLHY